MNLRALAEKATPHDAIFHINRYDHGGGRMYTEDAGRLSRRLIVDTYDEANREFIAALSPEVVIAMLDCIEAAKAYLDGYEQSLKRDMAPCHPSSSPLRAALARLEAAHER